MNQGSSDDNKWHRDDIDWIRKRIKKINDEGNMQSLYCLADHTYCDLTRKNCGKLIATISSEKMLAELAVNASINNNQWMTFAAIKCISTPGILEDIALRLSRECSRENYDSTEDVRVHLVDLIDNPSVLIEIHQLDKNETVKHRVLVRLLGFIKTPSFEWSWITTGTDGEYPNVTPCEYNSKQYQETAQYLLKCYHDGGYKYLGDSEVVPGIIRCSEIYHTVSDAETLKKICLEDKLHIVRVQAATLLSDSESLKDILRMSSDVSCRMIAAEKITDLELLSKIAVSDDNETVRQIAAAKVIEQRYPDGMLQIAIKGKDKLLRNVAIELLDDEKLAADVVTDGEYLDSRNFALTKVLDKNTIKEIILNCEDAKLRRNAIWKCDDIEILNKVLNEDSDQTVRESALTVIAMKSTDETERCNAVTQIDKEGLLERIVFQGKFLDTKRMALAKIRNPNVIKEIASKCQDPVIRKEAQEKI